MDAMYDDGRIAVTERGVTIRWYYLWGAKHISFSKIRSAKKFSVSVLRGRWRIWGSGDFTHWYNFDPQRPKKSDGIELNIGRLVRPCITPDDVDAVMGLIESHLTTK